MREELPTWTVPGYRLRRLLGEGGGGSVYLATQEALGRDVALKVFLPDRLDGIQGGRERLGREARILIENPHPFLVPLLDADLEAAPPYLALAYMAGGDLKRHVCPPDLLPPRTVLGVALRIVEALGHLHSQGITHRDLKPENVLLDPSGAAYLADLGLGKAAGSPQLTRSRAVLGTPGYLAPELAAHQEASPASDFYAFGILLTELLSGTRPTPRKVGTPLSEEVEAAVRVPGALPLLRHLLALHPADRPSSADEVAAALAALLATPTRQALASNPPAPRELDEGGVARPGPGFHPRPGHAALLLFAFLIGLAGGGAAAWPRGPGPGHGPGPEPWPPRDLPAPAGVHWESLDSRYRLRMSDGRSVTLAASVRGAELTAVAADETWVAFGERLPDGEVRVGAAALAAGLPTLEPLWLLSFHQSTPAHIGPEDLRLGDDSVFVALRGPGPGDAVLRVLELSRQGRLRKEERYQGTGRLSPWAAVP